MNNHYAKEFDDFETLLSKWKGAYVCAVHSYVGLQTKEGPRLLYGRVLLEPSCVGISQTSFNFQTQHVFAGRLVKMIGADDVVQIIAKAKAGQMESLDKALALDTEPASGFSAYCAAIYHPFISEGPRLPSLLVQGKSKHNLMMVANDARQLDWEMKAAKVPFDSLDELLGHCGLPALGQAGDSTTLEIVAKSPVAIGADSTIRNEEAVIACRVARALDVGKLRLGYRIVQKDQQVDRRSVTGEAFQWQDENDLKIGTHRFSVGQASFLQAFLSYDDVAFHQWWIADPTKHLNPRHAVHEVFDQDLKLLRKMLLEPETDKPYVFEGAVSTLLFLLGFSVANYGRIPKLQKGPDIVAITPLGHVGIIECTVGLLNENDKLAKLVQRTKLMKQGLVGAGYGALQLQSVLITPLSRNEVAAELAIAGQQEISVVCKENIEVMLNQVRLPPNADKMFQDAKRLIPGSEQQSFFQE